MMFVDTSAWFAMAVPSDQDHAAVALLFQQNTEPLLTTDYVVDETLTLLRARGYTQRALALGTELSAAPSPRSITSPRRTCWPPGISSNSMTTRNGVSPTVPANW